MSLLFCSSDQRWLDADLWGTDLDNAVGILPKITLKAWAMGLGRGNTKDLGAPDPGLNTGPSRWFLSACQK